MKNLLLTMALAFGVCTISHGQSRKPSMAKKPVRKTTKKSTKASKPAAQGYFKNKPSNRSQDKQLKRLEAEEKKNYAPKRKTNSKKKNN